MNQALAIQQVCIRRSWGLTFLHRDGSVDDLLPPLTDQPSTHPFHEREKVIGITTHDLVKLSKLKEKRVIIFMKFLHTFKIITFPALKKTLVIPNLKSSCPIPTARNRASLKSRGSRRANFSGGSKDWDISAEVFLPYVRDWPRPLDHWSPALPSLLVPCPHD